MFALELDRGGDEPTVLFGMKVFGDYYTYAGVGLKEGTRDVCFLR